jgi:purine-binding chemotaxis protein CheW
MTSLHDHTPVSAGETEYASFYVADALMGVSIGQVEEINHNLELTPVPHAPAWVRGVMNLRGAVVTVVDLRVVLGLEPTVITRKTCNVVVRSGSEQIAILADRVADVVRAPAREIEMPPANVAGNEERFFRGVYKLDRELLVILDIDAVLANDAALA